MKQYLILYQWYENTAQGIIKAESKDQALLVFAKWIYKLDCNYELERKYGYGGSISPFFYDEDREETFEEQFIKFLDSHDRGEFQIIEITQDTEGIITSISSREEPDRINFYKGQNK